jgi:hypothetical protein
MECEVPVTQAVLRLLGGTRAAMKGSEKNPVIVARHSIRWPALYGGPRYPDVV